MSLGSVQQLSRGQRLAALHRFMHLWYTYIDSKPSENPLATLLKLVTERVPLIENYFMNGRWLFKISKKNQEILDIKVMPILSGHARYRLMTRFGTTPEEAEKRFLLDFAKSQSVPQQIRDRLFLKRYDAAFKAENRVYLIQNNVVVTVLDSNWNAGQQEE